MDEYINLDLIGNAKSDSAIYDLPTQRDGKKGRPATHGERLSVHNAFVLSDKKSVIIIWLYAVCSRIFWQKEKSLPI